MSDSEQRNVRDVRVEKEKEEIYKKFLIENRPKSYTKDILTDNLDDVTKDVIKAKPSGHFPHPTFKIKVMTRGTKRYYYAQRDWAMMGFAAMMIASIIIVAVYLLVTGL